jgi:TetR/AcrR family transcriptional regulator
MVPKSKTRIKIRNEAKIIEAAQTLFAAHGYHGTAIEKIAEMAEMSQPNFHNYFKTKADLYEAVLNNTLNIWVGLIDNLDVNGDPERELRRYIVQKIAMARKYPEASRIFAGEMLQGAPVMMPHLKGMVRRKVLDFSAVIETWSRQGRIRAVDPAHLIFLIWGATQHYADFLPQIKAVLGLPRLKKSHFEAAAESIFAMIFNGLRADSGEVGGSPARARGKSLTP